MDVVKCGNWVTWVTEIPYVDRWVFVVVVCNDELCWNLWIPHHLRFFWSTWRLRFLTSKVVVHASGAGRWLSKVED